MYQEAELQGLVSWLPGWDDLGPIRAEIEQTWTRLRELRARSAEIRAELVRSCPLELTELEMRFWPKVRVSADDDSCWEWKNSRSPEPDNYGQFRWVNPVTGSREVVAASRVALFLTNGCLPDHACHTCDNPPCCRPGHLYDGTHQDNMRDRNARGRYGGWTRKSQAGTSNSQALLTDDLVMKARRLARDGLMLTEIHEQTKSPASLTVLRFAITGRTWKHLDATCPPVIKRPGPPAGRAISRRPPRDRGFSDDQVREIRAARRQRVPLARLAAQYGVSPGMISSVEHRRSYAHVS